MGYRLLTLLVTFESALGQPAAFEFLRAVAFPRSAALAQANVALPTDAGSLLLNPALGATLPRRELSSTFLKHVTDINSGAVLLTGMPLAAGRVAVGAVYVDYGTFERRDAQGRELGQFSAHDVALFAAYSDTLEPTLFYGLAAKLVWERLDTYHAWALALDAGLLYQFPDERTRIGVALLHAGTALHRFAHEALPLPTDLRIGLTHEMQGLPATVSFGFARLTEYTPSVWQKFEKFVVGIEFSLGSWVQLRFGYDNALRRAAPSSRRGATGLALGAGIAVSGIRIDYSTTLMSAAMLHRLGVQVGM